MQRIHYSAIQQKKNSHSLKFSGFRKHSCLVTEIGMKIAIFDILEISTLPLNPYQKVKTPLRTLEHTYSIFIFIYLFRQTQRFNYFHSRHFQDTTT